MDKAKPFDIPKREVWEAFKRVKANQGAAGVDGQSIAEFEANLAGNLYKLWKSHVLRELFSSAGAAGRYSEGGWRDAAVGYSDAGFIMHLAQFAFGKMRQCAWSLQPGRATCDRSRR